MMDANSALEQAIHAAQGGNKSQAQAILAELLRQEPQNEAAWLLLSEIVEKKKYAVDCLERVLKFNPDNPIAREKLQRLISSEHEILLPPAPSAESPQLEQTHPVEAQSVSRIERTQATKKCPYCAEEILAESKVCPFCERDLASPSTLPINTAQPTAIKPARSQLNLIATIILVVLLIFIVSRMGFYTVQPIGALPEGVTLIVWRASGEPFFNSPDGACIRIQGGVSLLCRLVAFNQAPVERIILRLPYMEWAYLMSTGGQVFER